MDEASMHGHHKHAKVQELHVHAIENGMSRPGTDYGSNRYPIFSPIKVEPNAYSNYRRRYYEDYDTLTKPPDREVLSYKGSRSMPQARYQFADPRYQNFSAAVHASYENIARFEGPPSYASSDHSTFARGGAKAKSMRYLTHRNPRSRKIRDSNTNYDEAKENRGRKKKTLWIICCLLIILLILAAIAVIVYFTVFASNGKSDSAQLPRRLKITFSFPIGYDSRNKATDGFASQGIFTVIQGVILRFNDASTMFALQPYAGSDSVSVVETSDLAEALRVLDRLFEGQYSTTVNPNLTAALHEYNSIAQKDVAFMHSLVVFAPEAANYDSVVSFENDAFTATRELNKAVTNTATDNTSVVMICDGMVIQTIQTNSPLVKVVNDTDKDSVTVLTLVMEALKPQVVHRTTAISSSTTPSTSSLSVSFITSSIPITSAVESTTPDTPTTANNSQSVTFTFNIAHYNASLRSRRSISKESFEVIEGIVRSYINRNVRFTLQPYAGGGNIPAIECANVDEALLKLENISRLDVSNENPNMTSAILKYCNETSTHTIDEHYSYVAFTPEEADYANIDEFMRDMRFASMSLEDLAEKQRNHSATVVIAANAEAAVYFHNVSDAKVVGTVGTTIEEIIGNISSALGSVVPTTSTVPSASAPIISNDTSANASSTAPLYSTSTSFSSTSTVSTASVDAGSSPPTLKTTASTTPSETTSTTASVASSDTPSSTNPTAVGTAASSSTPYTMSSSGSSTSYPLSSTTSTAPSDAGSSSTIAGTAILTTPSETTSTTAPIAGLDTPSSTNLTAPVARTSTAPSHTSTIQSSTSSITPSATTSTTANSSSYYPCSGDFIFVADASESVDTGEHRTGQYKAIMSITSRWTLDNSFRIRVSAASVGADFIDGEMLVEPFYSNHTDVNNAVIRAAANLPGPKIAPVRVAEMLRRQYCEKTSGTPLQESKRTIFIIFSGWTGAVGAVNVTQKSSWLGCSMATSETIFMAGVQSGSSDLASLGVPSSSLYYKVNDFSEKSVEELSTKIASEVCGVRGTDTSSGKTSTVSHTRNA
uniref:SEA domain-containing protein n=1 Tax=Parascaris univalens TaxID=6257 RepID=A0A915CB78_PARUN